MARPNLEPHQVPKQLLEQAYAKNYTLDLADNTSLATKTFTAAYGKPDYGGTGLSVTGPLLMQARLKKARNHLRHNPCGLITFVDLDFLFARVPWWKTCPHLANRHRASRGPLLSWKHRPGPAKGSPVAMFSLGDAAIGAEPMAAFWGG